MSTLSVRFPNSVHNAIKVIAKEEDISINQFVTSAVIEKITALDTEKYIEKRGARGSKEKFLGVLDKTPNQQPREEDIIKM